MKARQKFSLKTRRKVDATPKYIKTYFKSENDALNYLLQKGYEFNKKHKMFLGIGTPKGLDIHAISYLHYEHSYGWYR